MQISYILPEGSRCLPGGITLNFSRIENNYAGNSGMRELKVFVLVIFTVVAIVACGASGTSNSTSKSTNKAALNGNSGTQPVNTANSATTSALDAKQLYTESCQVCHRDNGKGGPVTVEGKKLKPADLTAGHSKKHPDDDLAKDISEGSPDDGMPAFKDKLKPEEIKAIVGYIRTLQQQ
jgi:mono/diheme cytochrome c family protein